MHDRRKNPEHDYYMNGVRLSIVEEEKDVGIRVNPSLKPARHCKRAAGMVF
jgi:hypothetical protein